MSPAADPAPEQPSKTTPEVAAPKKEEPHGKPPEDRSKSLPVGLPATVADPLAPVVEIVLPK